MAICALLAIALGAYVGGYFYAGDVTEWYVGTTKGIDRQYPRWLAPIYYPAGRLESWVRGKPVEISWPFSHLEENGLPVPK